MCELFGISAKKPIDIRGYLRAFFSHSIDNPHGWGLMREIGGVQEITKEAVCAVKSALLPQLTESAPAQKNALAHIRYATIGRMTRENCHPFSGADISGRVWTLIHNGTIYSGIELAKYLTLQEGETDSERILLYLIDEANRRIREKGAPLTEEERCRFIEHTAAVLAPRNKLNFIIYDGELMYAHKNMRETLVYRETDEGTVFSTAPLDGGEWKSVPLTRVIVYKDGSRIFTGEPHGHEFVSSLASITEFDAMNI